jgi:acetyltransferase-like isoleucine patch superfamily enzyme
MLAKLSRYICNRRKLKQLRNTAPIMLYGYQKNGLNLPDTRIGSSTTIVDEENLILEDNIFIGQYNFIEASNGITIREGCQITNFISIVSHSSHNSIRYYGNSYRNNADLKGYIKGGVEIGKYTFIGPHVTIMPNTLVGKGCIISAYSLLRGDYPDFSIIAGNPASVIGSTKDKDMAFLEKHPELEEYYNEWANR